MATPLVGGPPALRGCSARGVPMSSLYRRPDFSGSLRRTGNLVCPLPADLVRVKMFPPARPPAGWSRPRGRPAMNAFGRAVVSLLILIPAAARAQFVETTADPASVAL